jgi:hypothetical protein
MSITVMKQALEALEHLHRTGDTQVFDLCYAPKVIPALRTAIAEADKRVQLTVRDFVVTVGGIEDSVGEPVYWAEWPNREKK